MDDLAHLTLSEAARGIREGLFSAEALVTSYRERIARHEGRIHAWAWMDEQRALAQAREADGALRHGPPAGPLHGVPIGIKDIIYTQAIPTQLGSPIFAGFVPRYSATCVQKLELAGAFVHGKTVTTEFATQHPGPTTNPWNVTCTPGGSSSGSAAAVAARFTPAALGTQTRGSIIRPAAYCGIVGFKPSFGVISRFGVHELSGTLDHVGILARTIDDAGLLAAVLVGEDPREPGMVEESRMPRGLEAVGELEHPPHLAAIRSPAWDLADPAQRELFHTNCHTLRRHGARIDEVELPASFARAGELTRLIQLAEIARNFRALKASAGDQMSPAFRELCERGERITSAEHRDAVDARFGLRRAFDALFAEFDAIVTPPAAGEAPATLARTGDAAFCSIWTLCGLPCIVFPTGTGPRSLPMGLQVVGAYLDDRRTVRIAKWCARYLPFNQALDF